jgi:hypothetical protein
MFCNKSCNSYFCLSGLRFNINFIAFNASAVPLTFEYHFRIVLGYGKQFTNVFLTYCSNKNAKLKQMLGTLPEVFFLLIFSIEY